MTNAVWQPFREELAAWKARGITPAFWLRDDDAVDPCADLDALLQVTEDFAVPLVLAIVPANSGDALSRRLASAPHVVPAVHGWRHANHAPSGEKRQELGPHRDLNLLRDDCARGLARLRSFYGERLLPMLVPPWNRFDPALATILPTISFTALSAFGRGAMPVVSGLTIANAHIDLVDSRGTRRCHETPRLIELMVTDLRLARHSGDFRCGVLSHHLAADPRQIEFLKQLFEETQELWRLPV
jgi:hypothetical protein